MSFQLRRLPAADWNQVRRALNDRRSETIFAGFLLISAFNSLLILVLGTIPDESDGVVYRKGTGATFILVSFKKSNVAMHGNLEASHFPAAPAISMCLNSQHSNVCFWLIKDSIDMLP